MKFSTKALTLAVLSSTATIAMAEDTTLSQLGLSFSGSAALTSDYRFRGVTQAQNDPAVQATFALTHSSGLYAGVFGSNVNFGGPDPHLELDPYIGYSTALEGFTSKPVLDVGLWYYNYPSASDLNWLELYGKLTFKNAFTEGDSILTNINYTNDYAGADASSWNVNAGYSVPFGSTGFGGVANVGYTVVTDDDKYNFNGDDNYVDWKVGVTYVPKSIPSLTAELAAIGTNTDTDGLTNVAKRAVETGAVFTLTKAF
ncbi:MAG: TorF family putative porin [Acinetobacter sp.]|jgi:uncharacterized protein (TIGR02001 family)|nr:TorF family putative porin [Acinetobacter sp.]MDN5434601.1 TorF family putative porin [Acinetobacter sp.]MDN5621624.1 TorF family putative porin [Acinetobacter sp.]MDN5646869.1 TorF family putative porin [Acinetobacter sp.]